MLLPAIFESPNRLTAASVGALRAAIFAMGKRYESGVTVCGEVNHTILTSSMLGHCDVGFTLRTYTHATRQMQQKAAEKMGSFMAQIR